MTAPLPTWASLRKETQRGRPAIDVLATEAYEDWFAQLSVTEIDQYWAEVAFQCIKLDLQDRIGRVDLNIYLHDVEKKYALWKLPEGRGILAATKGKGARAHFLRVRKSQTFLTQPDDQTAELLDRSES